MRRYGIHRSAAIALVASALALLTGWGLNTYRGLDGGVALKVGESSASIRAADGREIPLGFTLLLQRRVDDYGPLAIRLGVQDSNTGAELGQIELQEGPFESSLAGSDLHLQLEKFSDETGDLFVQARTSGRSEELIFSLAENGARQIGFDRYQLFLVAHRLPPDPPQTRARLAILEGTNIVWEGWLRDGGEIRWRGVNLILEVRDGGGGSARTINVRAVKNPGDRVYWLAVLLFLGSFGMVVARRRTADAGPKPAASGVADRRRWLFAALGGLLAILLLEGGARVIEKVRDLLAAEHNPYLEMRDPAPIFEVVEENGRQVYRRTSHHRLILGKQSFLADKPENGYRVFLVGGSAAGGWPYSLGEYNIARFLERQLSVELPGRQVEVLNVAGGTFGSHRVKAVFDEIIRYQPDLILIYSGNNEFLEKFVFQRLEPAGLLKHVALARLVCEIYEYLEQVKPSFEVESYTIDDQASNRIAFAFGKASAYRRDPNQFREVLAHYRYNIDRMLETCQERRVPVLLLNVPVNLKDWIPNASQHKPGMSTKELDTWLSNFREGLIACENGDFASAEAALRLATAIDDEHAETWYWLGVAQLRLGQRGLAKSSFEAALERDAYPFRALPQMQAILRELAAAREIPLVDSIAALEQLTSDGIIGLDVMLDYVHPTLAGQEAIARQVVRVMAASGLTPGAPVLQQNGDTEAPYRFQPRVEAEAVEALYNQYMIMRQYDKLDQIFDRYLATMERAMREDPDLATFCRQGLEIIRQVHPVLQDYARLLRAEKLGQLEEAFTRQEAQAVYERYIDLIRRMEAPGMSRETFLQQVPTLEYSGAAPQAESATLPASGHR